MACLRARRQRASALRSIRVAALVALLVAGCGDGGDSTASDEVGARWEALPDGPLEGRFAAASASDGVRLFVWGGLTGGRRHTPLADGAIWNLDSGWVPVEAAPAPMAGPAAAVWADDRWLVVTSDNTEPVFAASYDPAASEWQELPPPPGGAREGFQLLWTGAELVIIGGTSGDQVADPAAAIYQPNEDHWVPLPSPAAGFLAGPAVWDGSRFVVTSGEARPTGSSSERPEATGALYIEPVEGSLAGGTWRQLTSPPIEVLDAAPTDGGVVAVGELDDGELAVTRLNGDEWSPSMPLGVTGDAVSLVPAGGSRAVLLGGSGVVLVDEAEVRPLPGTSLPPIGTAAVASVGGVPVVWGGWDGAAAEPARADGQLLLLDA